MSLLYLATCAEIPEGDEDALLLTEALAAVGIEGRWQSWDDPIATWDAAPTLIRSTWNYTTDLPGFLTWAASVRQLHNRLDAVRWSSDKTYLGELSAAGLPIVATSVFAPGETPRFPDSAEFVVKPSIGAGSRGAGRFEQDQRASAAEHCAGLQSEGRTVLVQPYLAEVDNAGETALLYFGGTFSHAIEKGPMLPKGTVHPTLSAPKGAKLDNETVYSLFVEERISPRTPTAAELEVGAATIDFVRARFGSDLLYARVDVLPSADGPVIGELELVEPSLFLSYSPGAATTFAEVVAAALSV